MRPGAPSAPSTSSISAATSGVGLCWNGTARALIPAKGRPARGQNGAAQTPSESKQYACAKKVQAHYVRVTSSRSLYIRFTVTGQVGEGVVWAGTVWGHDPQGRRSARERGGTRPMKPADRRLRELLRPRIRQARRRTLCAVAGVYCAVVLVGLTGARAGWASVRGAEAAAALARPDRAAGAAPAAPGGRRLLTSDETAAPTAAPTCGDAADGEAGAEARPAGLVVLYLCGCLYTFLALAIVCDEFFVPALEEMAERMDLSMDIAGATLMAAGGSAPELFTSAVATFQETAMGFGTIVGSAVFNVLFLSLIHISEPTRPY